MEFNKCIQLLLELINVENKTTLLAYSNSTSISEEKVLAELHHLVPEVVTYDFDTIVAINAMILIQTVILVVSKPMEVENFFKNWHKSLHFQSDCKYVIFATSPNKTTEYFDSIASAAWYVYAFPVFIIDSDGDVHVQKGYSADNCELKTTRRLAKCEDVKTNSLVTALKRGIFNFHGCPFTVLALNVIPFVVDVKSPVYRGLEPLYMEVIAEKMNFTIRYVDHNYTAWGEVLFDRITPGIYAGLQRRDAEMMIGLVFATEAITVYFDTSRPFYFTDLRFNIPLAGRKLPWLDITRSFQPLTWEIYAGTVTIFVLINYFAIKYKIYDFDASIDQDASMSGSFLTILSIALGSGVPISNNMVHRIVLMSWVIVAFIFASCFQCVFLSFLVRPTFEKQIKTYDDIAKSGFPIYGSSYCRKPFESSSEESQKAIYKRWKVVEWAETMDRVQELVDKGSVITSGNSLRTQYAMRVQKRFIDEHKRKQMYISEPIVSYFIWMVMQRGLPIKPGYNRMLQSMVECGWFQYFLKNITMEEEEKLDESSYTPIAMENILLAFIILAGGFILSIVIFLFELYYKN